MSLKNGALYFAVLFLFGCSSNQRLSKSKYKSLATVFEANNEQSTTYDEAILFYKKLAKASKLVKVNEFGNTDSGNPLHEVIIASNGDFTPERAKQNNKTILFINNGIHAGEPCGIDASMLFAKDVCYEKDLTKLLEKATVVIIPVYNISGSQNRGSFSRANQNGPQEYGFRANVKNLDLNRDFIKADSENALSFIQLFTKWSPEILIDNHTSNGADYQYVITLIASQKDKLDPYLSSYMSDKLLPDLYNEMQKVKYEMTPYVYSRNTPDEGIYGFMDYPRYSSGYATLHNCIGLISETHMLKPYKDRVKSIYYFMENTLKHASKNSQELISAKSNAVNNTKHKNDFAIDWELDASSYKTITFKGYEAKYKPSEVTGMPRLYYDRNQPYEKEVLYYNDFKASLEVKKPKAYIIPQAYKDVLLRLKLNGVEMQQLVNDTVINVEQYYIEDYTSPEEPYESHYLHRNVKVKSVNRKWQYRRGDYWVPTNQKMNRLVIETLEPHAPDSYFAWNFFDGILMQKEYYSNYVFEDTASKLLQEDKALKASFEQKKRDDAEFAKSASAQLDFIYKNSPYYEPTFRLYPVARIK